MDGRRRLLRPLRTVETGFAPAPLAYAGAARGALVLREPEPSRIKTKPRARRPRLGLPHRVLAPLTWPGAGFCLAAALLIATGVYGAVRGGHYDAFVASEGAPPDIIAKALGFGIEAVTIAGQSELAESEILAVAGIGPKNSLAFLDVAKVRERLRSLPLVKEASVTKLYPDRLLIEIEERQPFALWQKDGLVNIVAADGMPLDAMRDQRFVHLPLVVGAGANKRLGEYLTLLEAAGGLREKIRAGMLVSERHWTLKMTNGVDVLLPEINPAAALASLNQLQRQSRILDKDVISLDMRQPGRLAARLTEDAASARAESMAHKTKSKGGPT
jgi:cell division protein FtsQ